MASATMVAMVQVQAKCTRRGSRCRMSGFARPMENNGGGLLPWWGGGTIPTGQAAGIVTPPANPATGQPATVIAVSNYAGSFGDNYSGGPLCGGCLPWETYPGTNMPPGTTRIGWNGYWGTVYGDAPSFTVGGGSLRGYFDYQTVQFVKLASVTDGTSNTLMVGEVLPVQSADSNFWNENGCCAGRRYPSTGTPTQSPPPPRIASSGRVPCSVAATAPRRRASRACTRGERISSSATAPCTSSRPASVFPLMPPWAAAPAARSSAPTPTDNLSMQRSGKQPGGLAHRGAFFSCSLGCVASTVFPGFNSLSARPG